MPLNFGGQKRSGAFDTVWPSARDARKDGEREEKSMANVIPKTK